MRPDPSCSSRAAGTEGPAKAGPPTALLVLAGLALLWIYGYRISRNPLVWEEPRRCLVAMEMIERRDYIVPHLLGEIYQNKPPLQNWLLVILAGNRMDRVGAVPLRLISLLSLAGIGVLLWKLGRQAEGGLTAWAPPLIFLTLGIVMQYGRSGEVDSLFAFWIAAAFWCFESGRRTGSAWVQWFLSQALLAPGILTKFIAPIFFYPPALYLAFRDRRRFPFSASAFLAGLAAEILLVCVWLVPYSLESSLGSLVGHAWTQEALPRTPFGAGLGELLKHLISFPFEVLGNLLPWSLAGILWFLPAVRKALLVEIRESPFLRLSWTVSVWALLVFWVLPGGKGRFLIPAYPFFAVWIAATLEKTLPQEAGGLRRPGQALRSLLEKAFLDRPAGWILLALLWAAGLCLAGLSGAGSSLIQPLFIGIAILVAAASFARRTRSATAFQVLLVVALLYSIVYAGLTAVRRAERGEQLLGSARQIAEALSEPLPVVCGKGVNRGSCFELARHIGRVPRSAIPAQGTYYLVSSDPEGTGIHGTPIAEAPPLGLWRVEQP